MGSQDAQDEENAPDSMEKLEKQRLGRKRCQGSVDISAEDQHHRESAG